MLAFLTLIFLPVSLLGYSLYYSSKTTVQGEIKDLAFQTIRQASRFFYDYVSQLDTVLMTMYVDPNARDYFNYIDAESIYQRQVYRNQSYDFLSRLLMLSNNADYASLITADGSVLSLVRNGYVRPLYNYHTSDYFKPLIASKGEMVVLPTHESNYYASSRRPVITIGRKFYDIVSGIYLGTVFIESDVSHIQKIFANSTPAMDNSTFLLVDKDLNLIFVSPANNINENMLAEMVKKSYSTERKEKYEYYEDTGHFLFSTLVDNTDFMCLAIVPASSFYTKLTQIWQPFLILGIIITVLVIFSSWGIAKGVTEPLFELKRVMNSIRTQNDMTIRSQIGGPPEITDLSDIFNLLLDRIDNLHTTVKNIELRKREAELTALNSQVNPHFLYNTLESIRMMAIIEDKPAIGQAVESLADLFRYSIKQQHDIVPIAYEIKHAKNYLDLQQLRFGKMINVIWDIDQNLCEYKCIKFILQPLVENAIIHGMRNYRGIFNITIGLKEDNDSVILIVSDNGVGMTEDELLRIDNRLKSDSVSAKKDGLGIKNIHERLVLYFGHGLEIDSKKNIGTTVSIRIPKLKNAEEVENIVFNMYR